MAPYDLNCVGVFRKYKQDTLRTEENLDAEAGEPYHILSKKCFLFNIQLEYHRSGEFPLGK
jgi:hypothetical protein